MSDQLQLRGGTTADNSGFTGASRELSVDTTKDTVIVHDGSTPGGHPLLKEDQTNLPISVTNGLYAPGTNQVALATAGTGRLFVNAAGNVGIGTSDPAAILHSVGTSSGAVNETLRLQNLSDGLNAGTEFVLASNNVPHVKIQQLVTGTTAGNRGSDCLFFTKADNGLIGEKLRITSAGLVGIGTSDPKATLHTNGAILSSGALVALSASNIFFDQPTSALSRIGIVGANTSTAGTLSISQYSSNGSVGRDVFNINSSGNVGIGTNSPGYKLDVVATSGTNRIRVNNTGATSGDQSSIQLSTPASNYVIYSNGSEDKFHVYDAGAASSRLVIDSSGNVGIGTQNPAHKLTIQEAGTTANAELALNYIGASAGRTAMMRFQKDSTNFGYIAGATAMLTSGNADDLGIAPVSGRNLLFGIGATERARIDSSGRLLVGTSSSSATGTAVIQADRTQVIGRSATNVAASSTASIVLSTSAGLYHGFLSVSVVDSANASVSTSTTYSIFGRGATSSIQQIATNNGTGGARAFSVATPASMTIEVTNNAASNSNVYISFFGSLAA